MGEKHSGLFNPFQRSLTPDNHKKSHVFMFVHTTLTGPNMWRKKMQRGKECNSKAQTVAATAMQPCVARNILL